MASSERSALLTYRLCGGSGEEERGRERGRATAAAPRKLPTFLGVVVPTLLSMFSVVLFLRLGECRRPAGRPPPPFPAAARGPPRLSSPAWYSSWGPLSPRGLPCPEPPWSPRAPQSGIPVSSLCPPGAPPQPPSLTS